MVTALAALVVDVDHFQRRVVREAIRDAEAATYLRRAAQLEDARPRAGDWHGGATREDLRRRYDRLSADAQACRNRARVSLLGGEEW